MEQRPKKFFTKRELAARYSLKSTRSLERWLVRKRFPPPDIELPNGHKRWSDATVEAYEKASAVAATLPAKP